MIACTADSRKLQLAAPRMAGAVFAFSARLPDPDCPFHRNRCRAPRGGAINLKPMPHPSAMRLTSPPTGLLEARELVAPQSVPRLHGLRASHVQVALDGLGASRPHVGPSRPQGSTMSSTRLGECAAHLLASCRARSRTAWARFRKIQCRWPNPGSSPPRPRRACPHAAPGGPTSLGPTLGYRHGRSALG